LRPPRKAQGTAASGNGYCDTADVITGGVTCANTITPPGNNCQFNDPTPGDSCNEMVLGTIQNCVTTASNNNTHNQAAQLVIQNVEDLVGWQVQLNYLGDKLRPGPVNAIPFTDTAFGQAIGFTNLPVDSGTALHSYVDSFSNTPSSGSTLSVAAAAAATTVTVTSAAPFVVGNHLRIGPGTVNTNVDPGLTITNLAANVLTISPAISLSHNSGDPVFITDPQTALIGTSSLSPPSGFDFANTPDTPPKSPTPDDDSYAALTGGILATMNLSVAAGNAGGPSLFMNLDDGTPNPPGTSAVVFTGSGTGNIAPDTDHLGDGYVGNGATCVPLNCATMFSMAVAALDGYGFWAPPRAITEAFFGPEHLGSGFHC
jgi:hypothetical protein